MSDPNTPRPGDALDFDRAVPTLSSASGGEGAAVVRCASCKRPLTTSYYTAGGEPVCGVCRASLELAVAPVRDPAVLAKAIVYGFAASVVGAIIYYAVMRFLSLEIGLVAILTGYMVGKAMRKGANERGGRLMQVLAALLTYASVAMAYFPFALQSAGAAADGLGSSIIGTIMLFLFALALPVIAIIGSLPSGLISAAIIGFGMHQAWQLTAAHQVVFEGPFRVGAAPAA